MTELMGRQAMLSRGRMLRLLDELGSTAGGSALYFPPGIDEREAVDRIAAHLGDGAMPPDLARAVSRSATGAAVFWGPSARHLVLPPFPVRERRSFSFYRVEPLRSLLQADLTVALILVRLGAYSIGLCRGERVLAGKAGTGNVHARHKNGGWSQHRYERHRDKQMEYFFERACDHLRELVEPHLAEVDYALYGGERHTLLAFRKQCGFAARFEDRVVERLLDVHDLTVSGLPEAVRLAWSSRVTSWPAGEQRAPATGGSEMLRPISRDEAEAGR